jgi:hypothetical protein
MCLKPGPFVKDNSFVHGRSLMFPANSPAIFRAAATTRRVVILCPRPLCSLHRDRGLDGRMGIVTHEVKILVLEVVDVLHQGIQLQLRQGPGRAG